MPLRMAPRGRNMSDLISNSIYYICYTGLLVIPIITESVTAKVSCTKTEGKYILIYGGGSNNRLEKILQTTYTQIFFV
jgi:hypothetical protein